MKIGNNVTDKTGRGLKFLCIGLLLSVTLIWGYGIIATDEALTGSMGVFTMLAGRFYWRRSFFSFCAFAFSVRKDIQKSLKGNYGRELPSGRSIFAALFFNRSDCCIPIRQRAVC